MRQFMLVPARHARLVVIDDECPTMISKRLKFRQANALAGLPRPSVKVLRLEAIVWVKKYQIAAIHSR